MEIIINENQLRCIKKSIEEEAINERLSTSDMVTQEAQEILDEIVYKLNNRIYTTGYINPDHGVYRLVVLIEVEGMFSDVLSKKDLYSEDDIESGKKFLYANKVQCLIFFFERNDSDDLINRFVGSKKIDDNIEIRGYCKGGKLEIGELKRSINHEVRHVMDYVHNYNNNLIEFYKKVTYDLKRRKVKDAIYYFAFITYLFGMKNEIVANLQGLRGELSTMGLEDSYVYDMYTHYKRVYQNEIRNLPRDILQTYLDRYGISCEDYIKLMDENIDYYGRRIGKIIGGWKSGEFKESPKKEETPRQKRIKQLSAKYKKPESSH